MGLARLGMMAIVVAACGAQAQEAVPNPLVRKYQEGERIAFELRATHRGRLGESQYTAKVQGYVRRDSDGSFYEELAWSELTADGQAVVLPAEAERYRQRVSLDPRAPLRNPNLAEVHPALAAPVFDLVNFYGDLKLAARTQGLVKPGDRIRIPHNRANSWADGRNVLVGEDALDFEITLDSVDPATARATVTVRHVPPENPAINLVADWMKEPVAKGANNWTQLGRYPPGKYTAAAGLETLDIKVTVELGSGKIVSASMSNPVEIAERECEDVEAQRCAPAVRHRMLRRIELISKP